MDIAKSSIQTFIFKIAALFMATIGGIISARLLGPDGKGLLALALLYPSLFFVFGHFNIGFATVFRIGEKKFKKEEFAGTLFLLFAILSVALIGIFIITYAIFQNNLYKNIPFYFLALGMGTLPLQIFLYFFSSFLQGIGKIFWFNFVNHLPRLLLPFLVIGFWFFYRYTAFEGILINIIIYTLSAILIFMLISRFAPQKWKTNKSLLKQLLTDGSKLHLGTIATFTISRIDQIMIGLMLNITSLGYYAVATAIAELLWFMSSAVELVLYPKTSEENLDEAEERIKRSGRIVLFLTFCGGIIMAIASKYLILLYGGKIFLPAITPLIILLPGIVLSSHSQIISVLWVKKRWLLNISIFSMVNALLNILLNFIFIPRWGINGAALATTITYSVIFIFYLLLYRVAIKKPILPIIIPQKDDLIKIKNSSIDFLKIFFKPKF